MTRSYFDPYANPEFQKGTSEEDMAAYDQMVQTKKQQVKDGERDPSYLKNLEEIEARKQAEEDAQPNIVPHGLDYNKTNEAYEQLPEYDKPEGSEDSGLTTDTGLESQSGLDPEDPLAPLTDSEGYNPYQDKPLYTPTPYEVSTAHLASTPQRAELELMPRYKELRLDLGYTDPTTNRFGKYAEEDELIGNLKSRLSSVGPIEDTQDYKTLAAQIANINENFPDIARVYGGEDGLINMSDVLSSVGGAGYQNISSAYKNNIYKKWMRRSHALTDKDEYGAIEDLQEAQNRFDKAQGRMLRDVISGVEFTYDNWKGYRRYDEKSGLFLDTETNLPW